MTPLPGKLDEKRAKPPISPLQAASGKHHGEIGWDDRPKSGLLRNGALKTAREMWLG
jgi:hypothetical protein